jgi:hypothetical protein
MSIERTYEKKILAPKNIQQLRFEVETETNINLHVK